MRFVLGGKLTHSHGHTYYGVGAVERERQATKISCEFRLLVYPVLSNSSRFVQGFLV